MSLARNTIALGLLAVLGSGCNPDGALEDVSKCPGPDFKPMPAAARRDGRIYKVNDQLILIVPAKNEPSAGLRVLPIAACTKPTDLPLSYISFNLVDVKLPSQTSNLPGSEHRIWVLINSAPAGETAIDALGVYVPNVARRIARAKSRIGDTARVTERDGLTCTELESGLECVGSKAGPGKLPNIWVYISPGSRGLEAEYYSDRFGGLDVHWRVPAADLSDWRVIDEQVWESLKIWNLVRKPVT